MTEITDDPLLPNEFERPTREAGAILRLLVQVAVLAMCVSLAVASFFVARAAQRVARWAETATEATVEQQAMLVGKVDAILTEVKTATHGVGLTTDQATALLADLRAGSLPRINTALDDLHKTAGQVQDKIEATSPKIDAILEDTDATIRTSIVRLAVRSDQIGLVIAELQKTSANVAVITAPDQVEPLIAELRAAGANVNTATAHIAVIAANGETISADAVKVSNHYTEVLVPPPYHPAGNWFVRGMKHTGRFTLQILKATPQIILVGIQALP